MQSNHVGQLRNIYRRIIMLFHMVHCISLNSCQIPQHWFSLIVVFFFFYNSINSTTTSGMNPSKEYRIWSLISQGYLVLTKNGDNTPTLDCTGTGEEQTSKSEFVLFPLHFIVTVEKKWFFTSERSFRHHPRYTIACHILQVNLGEVHGNSAK